MILRIVISLLLLIHGLIHLIGFAKEWQLTTFGKFKGLAAFELPGGLVKTLGLLWLACSCLFVAVAIIYFAGKAPWWQPAFVALFISQFLVIVYWPEAKAGTIANLLILAVTFTGYSNHRFNNMVKAEVNELLRNNVKPRNNIITEDMLATLPYPVHNWLMNCGIIGKENTYFVRLEQKGSMRLKPGSGKWIPASAVQYISTSEPSYIWQVKMNMLPVLPLYGRDKCIKGESNMLVKAFSIFPVANESGPKINESSLQRYLAEICWYPSAALDNHIQWKGIDSNHAKAIITCDKTTANVDFTFDDLGQVTACSALRYRSNGPHSVKENWVVNTVRTGIKNGIRIPVESTVTWKLKKGDFTWYKIMITDIAYNIPGKYP